MREITNQDRADRARHAVTAYTSTILTSRPGNDAWQLALAGQHAAERFAQATRRSPKEHTLLDAEHACEVIGDLVGDLFHLFRAADERAQAEDLAAAVLSLIRPGRTTAARDLAFLTKTAPGTYVVAETAAAALTAAAVLYELDVDALLRQACGRFAQEVEDEIDDIEPPF
ncbi:hypothetical protein [Streptomyces sp. MP131-18]|uniref:hypothetical protein n=1 Tax=Streptomyces sp. MP131-18 TaxID=1857892 RepID=UPI00097C75CB|nr:hypothetical protein [Streptomyces sp. MP131-18]ONK13273.1 hypothetical protein STBA_40360 [Streptomyces sp. MP131-18]